MSSVSYYKRFEIYLEQGNWFKYSNKIRTVTEKSTKGFLIHQDPWDLHFSNIQQT